MRLVHVEGPADLRCGSAALGRLGQFVENARLGQRQVGRRQAAVQEADLARVEPVEGADLVGQRHRCGQSVVSDNTSSWPRALQEIGRSARRAGNPSTGRSRAARQSIELGQGGLLTGGRGQAAAGAKPVEGADLRLRCPAVLSQTTFAASCQSCNRSRTASLRARSRFSELQKNEPNRLKRLGRVQNCTAAA